MTTQEYSAWIDKLMAVKRIDTARTTSLPSMEAADVLSMYYDQIMKVGRQWSDAALKHS